MLTLLEITFARAFTWEIGPGLVMPLVAMPAFPYCKRRSAGTPAGSKRATLSLLALTLAWGGVLLVLLGLLRWAGAEG